MNPDRVLKHHHYHHLHAAACPADIPQSSTPENMCSIMATAARAHPLQLRQGLIWVWPEAGPQAAAEAAATPATLAPELEDPRWGCGCVERQEISGRKSTTCSWLSTVNRTGIGTAGTKQVRQPQPLLGVCQTYIMWCSGFSVSVCWQSQGSLTAVFAACCLLLVCSWISYYGWLWREVPVSIDYGIENALDSVSVVLWCCAAPQAAQPVQPQCGVTASRASSPPLTGS